ncbi:MAG: cyclic 3',5'-adenosine monophosphate phosphodiesterase [candidate division BRC1 bacterium ADurb.Bin183]|nr:MAG: cyclic 3',5'-adenosine monophosphate phosphodiesterase [candidate division BRC1 bacterium ADurb.Bin183]
MNKQNKNCKLSLTFAHKAVFFLNILLLFSILAACSTLPNKSKNVEKEFSFAWLSDTHIVTIDKGAEFGDRTDRLEKVMEKINGRNEIDFIVVSGDLIENVANVEQFEVFDKTMRTNKPVYFIPGNHDIGNTSDMKNIKLWLNRGYGKGNPAKEYYGFTHKGAAFFVLNTFAYQSKEEEVLKRSEEQLQEMDKFFADNSFAKCKIVCGHAPLFILTSDEPDEYFNIKKEYREKIIEIMKKHNARYYLCGHRHGEHKVEESWITLYTQGALSWAIGEGQKIGYSIFTFVPEEGLKKEFFEEK